MIKLDFTISPVLNHKEVRIEVSWEKKKYAKTYRTGLYVEPQKWDVAQHRASANCINVVIKSHKRHTMTSEEINDRLSALIKEIEKVFCEFSLKNIVPKVKDMNNALKYVFVPRKRQPRKPKEKTLDDLMTDFLNKGTREKGWDFQCREKYTQALMQLKKAVPGIKVNQIKEGTMIRLCEWFVGEGYKNKTMKKQIIMLKAFLRYINSLDGYSIPSQCLFFEDRYKEIQRTVVFLTYEEIIQLYHHDFWYDKELALARDLWCFMAFTSLRYSDLCQLKPYHIIGGKRLELFTEKTDTPISVPLSEYALHIIRRSGKPWRTRGPLFDVPNNTILNINIKICAEDVGLTREIVDHYYVGSKRVETVNRLCDIISCHDARRSFVSNSLGMGIPAPMVMKCTGHSNYNSMRPYIGIADDTQARAMQKWNTQSSLSQIYSILDKLNGKQLTKAKRAILEISWEDTAEDDMYVPESLFEYDDIATGGISDMHVILEAIDSGQLFYIRYSSEKFDREVVTEEVSEYKVGDTICYYDEKKRKWQESIIAEIY